MYSLFILSVEQKSIDGSVRTGKLNFADLAGTFFSTIFPLVFYLVSIVLSSQALRRWRRRVPLEILLRRFVVLIVFFGFSSNIPIRSSRPRR
jgi:hypothetical protein